mmetsp:Transcript_41988/g.90175  ORF Transcript_41988/g.90175 Transcript_41988/m.90175 type:complete len:200 (+) Transcript_41988:753-1352(+)
MEPFPLQAVTESFEVPVGGHHTQVELRTNLPIYGLRKLQLADDVACVSKAGRGFLDGSSDRAARLEPSVCLHVCDAQLPEALLVLALAGVRAATVDFLVESHPRHGHVSFPHRSSPPCTHDRHQVLDTMSQGACCRFDRSLAVSLEFPRHRDALLRHTLRSGFEPIEPVEMGWDSNAASNIRSDAQCTAAGPQQPSFST